MKKETKAKLKEAQQYCDANDKSTEFMIQYMQDFAGVSFETVLKYLQSKNK
jgi:hypothetical protein